ncbi:MAG TPA: ABC transporter substrate-binding protein [Methylomirabilota bacterium]|jgi:phospholipid transport system substrate-binding protein|nr:ABC transporter substrate-binding protein [Methylomirabilota bacterium]
MPRTTGWILAAVVIVLGGAAAALAGPPTEQVRQYTDHVQQILDDPALKQADKREAVRKVAEQVFDVNETAKRALGIHWQKRTAAEREEFVQLFADLLESTYIAKIDLYGGEKVQYTGELVDGDYATVRAKIVTKQRTEVPVEAKMLKRGERWLIYDIAIENVSLVGNYRSQFDRIIRTSSYQELLKRLKTKRDEFLPRKEARPARS